jgi:hypothetical protein
MSLAKRPNSRISGHRSRNILGEFLRKVRRRSLPGVKLGHLRRTGGHQGRTHKADDPTWQRCQIPLPQSDRVVHISILPIGREYISEGCCGEHLRATVIARLLAQAPTRGQASGITRPAEYSRTQRETAVVHGAYVAEDNAERAIDVFADELDLRGWGLRASWRKRRAVRPTIPR